MSDPDDIDLIAAEFVLGTLDAEERAQVESRLMREAPLKDAVDAWEDRLSPLLGLYAEAPAPPHLLTQVLERLDAAGHRPDQPRPQPKNQPKTADVVFLRQSRRRWRMVAGGAMALAAALTGWIVVGPGPAKEGRFVAVLQKDANSPAILLSVDIGARRAVVRQVSSEQPSDKSYELWLINPEVGAPRSLGLIDPKGSTNASLSRYESAVIARATYAVTVEPLGGSPNGLPSGPPILSGKLVDDAH